LTSSTNRALYINGNYVATDTNNRSPGGINNIRIGSIGPYWISQGYPSYFSGSIDDVRVYNRALSASEVKQLYNMGR
jgi:hypothetical protein